MNAIAQASAAPDSGSKLDNRRVMAAIVDLLIVTAGAAVILVAGDSLSGDRPGALAAVIVGWALYYFFALESGEGQTLGKGLMKIRVMRADGRPAGMGEIAVRTILRVIDNYLVGLIVMLATGERRQRIGDLAAGTMIVDAAGPAVMAPPAAPDVLEPVEDEPEVELDDDGDWEWEAEEPEAVEDPAEEELPPAMSPALDELSEDVAAAHDEPVNVRSVETVSAMDLIMGAAEEDTNGEEDLESASDAERPASA